MIDYTLAIKSLKSDAQFYLSNVTDLNSLEWKDGNPNNITNEQIETEWIKVKANYDAKEYQRKRKAEYPPVEDYLDGIVKNDQTQIDKYIADCKAVKEKYPK